MTDAKKSIDRRDFLGLTLAVTAGGAMASASRQAYAQDAGKTLVWGMVGSPRHLNPAVQSGINTMEPGAQIFASPLRFDENYKPQPYLAESWAFEDGGRSLRLKLVQGATFHDGKPITSGDVAFSIMTVKANHPFSAMMAPVEKVDAPDAATAIIRLSQPHPAMLDALSPPFCPVLPKHIFGDGQDPKTHPRNANPVGSGPYKCVEFKPGEHVIMQKHAGFFIKGKPYFDRVILRIFKDPNALALAMEAKEVHYAPFLADLAIIDRLAKVNGLEVSSKGGEAIGPLLWLAFNTARKPLDDKRVRQAISYAIDREFITKRLHRGRSQIATGPITPGTPFYNDAVERYRVDLAKAEALLDDAGLKKDASGARFKLGIVYQPGTRDFSDNIAEYAKAQLKKIGVDLELQPIADFPTWATRVGNHEFDITIDAVFNWGDPVVGVHRTYLSSNIRKGVIWSNTQNYRNARVDELLAKAAVEPDATARKALYHEFQKIVVDEAPQAFINVLPYHSAYDRRLEGLPNGIWGACSTIDDMRWKA